ncbi:hypothetical protein Q5P01_018029 [Channa striata]|uniref:Uncharacterized protein n=1 Tax=Channa striata TaxID=64152 RepID=A0AA88M745_CHASR|nr:hypothetical protein Q5P01_018029 [Channa striata]
MLMCTRMSSQQQEAGKNLFMNFRLLAADMTLHKVTSQTCFRDLCMSVDPASQMSFEPGLDEGLDAAQL